MSQLSSPAVCVGDSAAQPEAHALQHKYERANALVASVLNKYYNGSSRAVDPFVIRRIQEEETRLFSIQCFVEEGPAESRRERKESSVTTRVTRAPTFTVLDRIFGVCGGYLGGPGSVMRRWEELSDTGYDDAMREYIALVDKIAPGWDQEPLDYPVSRQERFWKDDATALQCQYCGAHFSLQNRRHHCRMCLDVFCQECCSESLEIALCPGAPLRVQRVCCQCFHEAERNKSLLEVRRVIRENYNLEQQIKQLQVATAAQLAAKQREESKLRQDALANGCDMESVDASILRRIGSTGVMSSSLASSGNIRALGNSSSSNNNNNSALSAVDSTVSVQTPPAHKFAPRETVEANEQLALANRQLLMGLKVAQCRAKRAFEKMDIALAVLREAICFGSSNWNVVLRRARVFLTLSDLKALALASKAHRAVVARCKCESKCVLEQDVTARLRPALWQMECLRDDKTRLYVSDLADEIRMRLDTSDSDTEDSGSSESASFPLPVQAPPKPLWLSLLVLSAAAGASSDPTTSDQDPAALTTTIAAATDSPRNESTWDRAYALILARCTASTAALEFDEQIECDVQRTFGASALRKMQHKRYQKADSVSHTPEVAVEQRRSTLANVLRSFSSVNTEIGYCQGMDHVTAVLLSVVDWHEARAFWLLTSLIASPRYELDALYSPGLPHLGLRCYQLERVMALHLPVLARYLGHMDFPISMLATNWFMTLFTSMETLSYDAVLRVLDGFLTAGWKQIFRVALVILDSLQHQILASAFEEIPQIFYDIPEQAPQLANVHDVLARAASFKVTNSQLKRFQSEFETSSAATLSAVSPSPSSARPKVLEDIPAQPTLVLPPPSSAAVNANAKVNGRAHTTSSEPSSRRSESSSSAVLPTGNTTMKAKKAPQLAVAAADANHDRGEKSPDSTRAATPLRSSVANTRVVV